MSTALTILETAFRSMATIILVNMVGAVLVFYPVSMGGLLTRPFIRQLAKLFNDVLLPSMLISGLGSKFTLKLISEAWILVVVAAIHVSVGFISSLLLVRIAKPSPSLRRPFVASLSLHNALALPLILFTTLADQDPVNEDEDALETGSTYIFIYMLCNLVIMWGIFPTFLRVESGGSEASGSWKTDMVKAITHPGMLGAFVGLFIGCIKPLQKALFEDGVGVLNPIGKAISMIGEPGLGIMVLVLSASLGHGLRDAWKEWRSERDTNANNKGTTMTSIDTEGGGGGEEEGEGGGGGVDGEGGGSGGGGGGGRDPPGGPETPPLVSSQDPPPPPPASSCYSDPAAAAPHKQDGDGENRPSPCTSPPAAASTTIQQPAASRVSAASVTTTISTSDSSADLTPPLPRPDGVVNPSGPESKAISGTASSLAADSVNRELEDDKGNEEDYQGKLTLYQLLVFAVGRTIITPLLLLGVNIVLKEVWLKDQDDPLLVFIVFLEPITPSPTSIITLLQSLGRYRATESLAQGFLIQYIISIISMTVFTGLALHFAYD